MREIHSCPEVTALVGAEQLARLQAHSGYGPYRCWQCDKQGDVNTEPAAVIAEKYGLAVVVRLAHARCADPQVVTAAAAPQAPPGGADMAAIAGILPNVAGQRPLLVLEPRSDLFTLTAGDRINLLATGLLDRGWTLMRSPGQIPHRAPGWTICLPSPGRLRLAGPGGEVMYEGQCTRPREWDELAAAGRGCIVLAGRVGLYSHPAEVTIMQMTRMLGQAAKTGELVGARVQLG
jgi:hypothetical protein